MKNNDPVLLGRYYSPRDMRFFNSINDELLNNIIQTFIQLYRISTKTETNVYGEANNNLGKIYEPGIIISARIENPENTSKQEGFGPDRVKTGMKFMLNELFCRNADIYPVQGDIIYWNDIYFEIDNVVQNEFLGGQYEKSFSIICQSHATKTSSLNIIPPTQTNNI